MKSETAKAIGVTKIFQVMKGKQKVMDSRKTAQRGRKMREELQYSVLEGKSLNNHYETAGHHHQPKKEGLKITVDTSLKILVHCCTVTKKTWLSSASILEIKEKIICPYIKSRRSRT